MQLMYPLGIGFPGDGAGGGQNLLEQQLTQQLAQQLPEPKALNPYDAAAWKRVATSRRRDANAFAAFLRGYEPFIVFPDATTGRLMGKHYDVYNQQLDIRPVPPGLIDLLKDLVCNIAGAANKLPTSAKLPNGQTIEIDPRVKVAKEVANFVCGRGSSATRTRTYLPGSVGYHNETMGVWKIYSPTVTAVATTSVSKRALLRGLGWYHDESTRKGMLGGPFTDLCSDKAGKQGLTFVGTEPTKPDDVINGGEDEIKFYENWKFYAFVVAPVLAAGGGGAYYYLRKGRRR